MSDAADRRLAAGGDERRQPHAVHPGRAARDRPVHIHPGESPAGNATSRDTTDAYIPLTDRSAASG